MRKLKVGIDIHSIGSRKGGNETYYRELLRELYQLPCEHEFFLYHTNLQISDLSGSSSRFRFDRLRPAHPLLRIPLTIPWHARRHRLDVFHAQFLVPPFLKCKTVTHIPDLAYEHFPEMFAVHERM